jgi:hypothetical protein
VTVVLGVDPGAASTGLVLRDGDDLLAHATAHGPWDQVLTVIWRDLPATATFDLVAIEEVIAPHFYRGKKMLDPKHAIATARVAGAVAGWAWSGPTDVIWVPPGHNGQGDLTMYPEPLRPTRGHGRGADSLRHVRSAWDVAGLGLLLARHEVPA